MATKQQIQAIKRNVERTTQGLFTEPNEFIYQDNQGLVKPNTLYSVYYTLNKTEVYLTGIRNSGNSRIIERLKNKTLYGVYSELGSTSRDIYPKPHTIKPTESDYRIGEVTRYFTQKANDTSQPVFEVSKQDFENQSKSYEYTSFQWVISGLKQDVERENTKTIRGLETELPGISRILFPLQLWTPPKDSKEDLENKLSRLKK